MKINDIKLDVQAIRRSQYPEVDKPEFMLIGRSNVGKSTFINTVAEQYNGGGHKMASGAKVKTMEEVEELIKKIDEVTFEYRKENGGIDEN